VFPSHIFVPIAVLCYVTLNNAQCTHFHAPRFSVTYSFIGLLLYGWTRM